MALSKEVPYQRRVVEAVDIVLHYQRSPWTNGSIGELHRFKCYVYRTQRNVYPYEVDLIEAAKPAPRQRPNSLPNIRGLQDILREALAEKLGKPVKPFHQDIILWPEASPTRERV